MRPSFPMTKSGSFNTGELRLRQTPLRIQRLYVEPRERKQEPKFQNGFTKRRWWNWLFLFHQLWPATVKLLKTIQKVALYLAGSRCIDRFGLSERIKTGLNSNRQTPFYLRRGIITLVQRLTRPHRLSQDGQLRILRKIFCISSGTFFTKKFAIGLKATLILLMKKATKISGPLTANFASIPRTNKMSIFFSQLLLLLLFEIRPSKDKNFMRWNTKWFDSSSIKSRKLSQSWFRVSK